MKSDTIQRSCRFYIPEKQEGKRTEEEKCQALQELVCKKKKCSFFKEKEEEVKDEG